MYVQLRMHRLAAPAGRQGAARQVGRGAGHQAPEARNARGLRLLRSDWRGRSGRRAGEPTTRMTWKGSAHEPDCNQAWFFTLGCEHWRGTGKASMTRSGITAAARPPREHRLPGRNRGSYTCIGQGLAGGDGTLQTGLVVLRASERGAAGKTRSTNNVRRSGYGTNPDHSGLLQAVGVIEPYPP
jgi:hypothetical protein